jgi:hypothetical protein
MQIPPDAAPDQGAELTRAAADAPAEIEHHQALQQRAELERDLPRVIGPQLPVSKRVRGLRRARARGEA